MCNIKSRVFVEVLKCPHQYEYISEPTYIFIKSLGDNNDEVCTATTFPHTLMITLGSYQLFSEYIHGFFTADA